MKKISRVTSVVFFLIAAYAFYMASTFPPGALGVPGPGYFPKILSVLVMILAIIEFVQSIKNSDDAPETGVKLFSKENSRVWISLGLIIIYFIGLFTIGFIISTLIYLFVMLSYFKVKNIFIKVGVPIALTAVLYFVFTILLKVQLPSGMLF